MIFFLKLPDANILLLIIRDVMKSVVLLRWLLELGEVGTALLSVTDESWRPFVELGCLYRMLVSCGFL